jgi:integrase/recombinase XerD
MPALTHQHKQELDVKFDQDYRQFQQQQTDPVTLYLQSLAPSGRRAIKSRLISATQIIGLSGALETMPWPLIAYQHLALIRNTLKQQAKTANTINLTLSALRGVMKACFHLGLIKADQLLLLNAVKPVNGHRLPSGRSLTNPEIHKLLRVCQDKTIAGKRDQALIALMLATGLRRSEVSALTIEDVNSRTGLLTIQAGKGNKPRCAYLNTESRALMRQWRKLRGSQAGFLFNPVSKSGVILNRDLTGQSVYDIIQQRAKQAQIGNVRPHDLRRTFVTRLLEAGVDLNTTRQLAGHSDIQTTASYDCRDEKTLKRAIRCLSF